MNSPSGISHSIRKVLKSTLENGTATNTVGTNNLSNLQLKYPSTTINKKSVNLYPGKLNPQQGFFLYFPLTLLFMNTGHNCNLIFFVYEDLLASTKPKTTMNSTSSNHLYSSIQ